MVSSSSSFSSIHSLSGSTAVGSDTSLPIEKKTYLASNSADSFALRNPVPFKQTLVAQLLAWKRGTQDIKLSNNDTKLQNLALVEDYQASKEKVEQARRHSNRPFDIHETPPVGVYRGAAPQTEAEYRKLVERYKTGVIIDLRGGGTTSDKALDWSKLTATKVGLQYENVPLSSMRVPKQHEFQRVRDIIAKARAEGKGVYIHCKYGVDRTGVIVADHEMHAMNLSKDEAYKSMKVRGYDLTHNLVAPQRVMRIHVLEKETRLDEVLKTVKKFLNHVYKHVMSFLKKLCRR